MIDSTVTSSQVTYSSLLKTSSWFWPVGGARPQQCLRRRWLRNQPFSSLYLVLIHCLEGSHRGTKYFWVFLHLKNWTLFSLGGALWFKQTARQAFSHQETAGGPACTDRPLCSCVAFTLASWAFRSFTSASRLRLSPRAVLRAASLELSSASRSLSRARAASSSDSFLLFLWRPEQQDVLPESYPNTHIIKRNCVIFLIQNDQTLLIVSTTGAAHVIDI